LAKPALLAVACVVLVGGTWFAYQQLGSDLLPEMDEGGFILDYIMPAGSALSETNRVLDHVERILHSMPEVDSTSRRTGLQMGLAAVTEANTGDFTVHLKNKRSRGIDEIIADVREQIKTTEPELSVEFPQVLQDMIDDLSNAPEPIQIKVFSNDQALLNQGSRRCGGWHRQHDQRTGDELSDRSCCGGATGVYACRGGGGCNFDYGRAYT
jgi:multidrug efflux pump subunit AcrB